MKRVIVPYRVCLIGANSDHQLGKTLGVCINQGIKFTYEPSNDIRLTSNCFDREVSWRLVDVTMHHPQNDWADYFRGVTLFLKDKISSGVKGHFEGTLPVGGLASSSAVTLAFIKALCDVNHLTLSSSEMIDLVVSVENYYVNVKCGLLDPMCEIHCKKNNLLYIDMKTKEYQNFESNLFDKVDIIVFFSGEEHRLASSSFNQRVLECTEVAKLLSKECYLNKQDVYLRDIPRSVFDTYAESLLTTSLHKRALHYYTEVECVERGLKAWQLGDLEEFGKWMTQSGNSVIKNYESSSPEINSLQKIISHTEGVYGVRPSGAGIKGSCIALVDKNKTRDVLEQVSEKYLDKYPEHSYDYSHCVCKSCDGIEFRR